LNAGLASDAKHRKPLRLQAGGEAFGIVAPGAVKRAALEEDGSAEAGTVFGGEALEVEEEALRRGSGHQGRFKRFNTKEHEGLFLSVRFWLDLQ